MNKYQEALDRLKTTMSDGDSAYKSYTDSYTVFFEDINTIQELVDIETPKKLVRYTHSNEWHCPTCGSGNGEYEGTVGTHNYCHYCGQKLDWSNTYE